jgi:superoxide dismutase
MQYQNQRPKWIQAFMRLANWPMAAKRLAAAQASR